MQAPKHLISDGAAISKMTKITDEIRKLFRKCRTRLGAPVMEVEMTDDQLCDLLDIAVEDYAEKVQNWVVENNWANLYGHELSSTDLTWAFTVRTMDMTKDFSYWFSKDAGVQQRGPWELKKDFITIETGKQDYLIPAGREINRVMWCNPSTSQAALYANYGGLDMLGFAGGYGQAGGSYGPIGGFYIAQSCDIAYMATDLTYKNRLLRGDLTYKVTAGPDGTRILHLYSTPGSKFTFGSVANIALGFPLAGMEVWYTYYDVASADVDECRRINPDVIISPDQIPLDELDYAYLNEPAKIIVRKLFFAEAKKTLANIRGKFSGKISIMDAEANLDYTMLYNQGKEEYDAAMKELMERLDRMTPVAMLKKEAEMTEAMKTVMAAKALNITTC